MSILGTFQPDRFPETSDSSEEKAVIAGGAN
jgi:hypothetical protein